MSLTLDDYIQVYEDRISSELCDVIIGTYEHTDLWEHRGIGQENKIDTNIRLVDGINISHTKIKLNNGIRTKIDNDLFNILNKVGNEYVTKFPLCSISHDSGYELLRYKKGYFYKLHIDKIASANDRTLSCIIALNDDYNGGEIAFFYKKKIIKLKRGSVLIFPSNFIYPHEVLPITSGERYSIVTWFI
jgi:predicted 2-oxoglutarate/Fe(II)-dependent dioxygenase YbiX